MRRKALSETSTSAVSRPQRERKVAAENVIRANFYKKASQEAYSPAQKKEAITASSYSLSMRFFKDFTLRLANSGRQRQGNNQQRKYHAEGHVEPAEQGGNQRTADTADPEP